MRVRILVAFALAASLSSACGSTPLRLNTETRPSDGCLQALLRPVRVERQGDEVTFRNVQTGEVLTLVWPFGFSAGLVSGRAEILDAHGRVIAREGDILDNLGGGSGNDDRFHVCF